MRVESESGPHVAQGFRQLQIAGKRERRGRDRQSGNLLRLTFCHDRLEVGIQVEVTVEIDAAR